MIFGLNIELVVGKESPLKYKQFPQVNLCRVLTALTLNFALYMPVAFANGNGPKAPEPTCVEQLTGELPLEERQQSADEQLYAIEKHPTLGTAVRFYKGGRIPEQAVARVLLLHGFGAFSSQATSMNEYLKFFTNPDTKDLKDSSSTKRLQAREIELFGPSHSRRIGMEAMDLPGTPNGAALSDYETIDEVVDKIIVPHIRFMQSQTPGIPIFVLTRSGSSVFGENIARRYPDLAKGMVLTSPTMPDAVLNEKAKRHLMWEESQGIIRVNWPSLNWIIKLFSQHNFDTNTFSQVPSLILNGDTDDETDDIERRFYALLADKHPNIEHHNIPFAGHDVVRVKKGVPLKGEDGEVLRNQKNEVLKGPSYNERKVEETLFLILDFIARVAKAS